jgi:hypothetical protein
MSNAKELVIQQQKQALEELGKTTVTLARLRKLVREQSSYEPAAFEESVKVLMEKLGYTGRRFSANIAVLVALRCGRVKGVQYE